MKIKKELNYTILSKNEQVASHSITLKLHKSNEQQMHLIHRALKQQLKNKRIRNAHSKKRSEVKGGGKKPWKQKGTGRARAGSNRSPLWRGGGVIFGPRQKIYASKINRKEKRLAINTILVNKFPNTIVINNILPNISKPNTKKAILGMTSNGINIKKEQKILIMVYKKNKVLHLSFRNIKNVELLEVQSMNIISLLKADIIILDYNALLQIDKILI
uniref:Large ribosomal subunit protein uL4c n=1 Tax=Herposiphonia versicolor TaxID=2007163 RepID=A0A1Z1MFZ3_9FLOR|nr:ribosomal protein L4 [Herposiphonia versicolor]ARW64809.1 ribosomal protein L4 [Herposiphonia versicolor]